MPPFRNTPTVALLFLPVAFFPIALSYKIFIVINTLLVLVFIKLFSREFPELKRSAVFFISLCFFPTVITIVIGQISFILLLLWFYLLKSLKNKQSLLCGILCALLFNKLQYLLFVPFVFILSSNRKKFLKGFFTTFTIQLLISIVLVGWQGIIKYPAFLLETESPFYASDVYSQMTLSSAIYFVKGTLGLANLSVNLINALFYLLFFLIFIKYHHGRSYVENFSVATFFTLALVPHAWEYNLVFVLIPLFYILGSVIRGGRKNKKLKIALFTLVYLSSTFRFFTYPFLISFVMIAVGMILLLKPQVRLLD
jgi:alpha-1,2-mannosyltransferase